KALKGIRCALKELGPEHGRRVAVEGPPSVLYTWTTGEQIQELRAAPATLLTRADSPQYGATAFALALIAHESSTGDPISRLLNSENFARHRYAWHQPWATEAGWIGESYGDQLIAVRLKAEAWVGIFKARARAPWRFVDMMGHTVPLEDVLAHPERIGAVFHEKEASEGSTGMMGTFLSMTPAFREFVLVNNEMIASWSYGTDAIVERLRDDAEMLDALATQTEMSAISSPIWDSSVEARWLHQATIRLTDAPPWIDTYVDNLAFVDIQYVPTALSLHNRATRLRQRVSQGDPIEYPAP
ncbi:MAG: hypothetical protein AAFV53_14795, partial [Myxococcota bacterium]